MTFWSFFFTAGRYNAEWLFDGWDDKHRSPDTAARHISRVAQVIANLSADVVNVVELEDCNVLTSVARQVMSSSSSSSSSSWAAATNVTVYVPESGDTSSRQTIGVVSRHPLLPPGAMRSEGRHAYPVAGSKCGYTASRHRSSGVSKHWFGVYRCVPVGRQATTNSVKTFMYVRCACVRRRTKESDDDI